MIYLYNKVQPCFWGGQFQYEGGKVEGCGLFQEVDKGLKFMGKL